MQHFEAISGAGVDVPSPPMNWRRAGIGLLLLGGLSFATSAARGAILPADPLVSGGGPYTLTYPVNLSTQSQVQTGDYFTIYDFGDYSAASIFAPTGWSAFAELTTAPPPGVVLLDADNPQAFNLRFVRTGTTIVNTDPSTSINLGSFGAQSLNNTLVVDLVAYQNHDNSNPGGFPATGQNATLVPLNTIPEPAAAAALAVFGAALLARRQRSE